MAKAKDDQKPEEKRMNLNIPLNLHNAFKAITAAQGKNMTDVLTEFIQHYVDTNGVDSKKKARR